MDLDWLDDGSLYILLPERLLDVWYRADSDDYNRACAAGDNWLNLLSVGDGVGLVLGGDPGMALAIPDDRGDTVLIRWIFADDEYELVAFALRGEDITETEPDIEFDSPAAHWRLFNAAARLQIDGNPSLRVVLPVGHVRARTAYLRSGPNAAIVHRFSSATPDITLHRPEARDARFGR